MLFLTAVGAISGLTFILATALVLANKKLYVYATWWRKCFLTPTAAPVASSGVVLSRKR